MTRPKSNIIRAIAVSDETGQIIGQSLQNLRERAGITPARMAHRLKISPSALARIERGGDVSLPALRRYVETLGATLRIEAAFPTTRQVASQFNLAFDPDTQDEDQLVFPLFDDELFRRHRDVVLSIRPHYSSKIIEGSKTIELRRRFPLSAPRGTIAYIYSTSPVQAIVGRAEIADVLKLPLPQIWKQYGKSASIKRPDFDSYFSGLEQGFALKFANARPFPRPIPLPELRDRFGFEPPQSYLYATPLLRKALYDEFASLSD